MDTTIIVHTFSVCFRCVKCKVKSAWYMNIATQGKLWSGSLICALFTTFPKCLINAWGNDHNGNLYMTLHNMSKDPLPIHFDCGWFLHKAGLVQGYGMVLQPDSWSHLCVIRCGRFKYIKMHVIILCKISTISAVIRHQVGKHVSELKKILYDAISS